MSKINLILFMLILTSAMIVIGTCLHSGIVIGVGLILFAFAMVLIMVASGPFMDS